MLRDGVGLVVDHPRVVVKHDVLQHGAELDGVEDLGFVLVFESDRLGVTAALDVEHPAVPPACRPNAYHE